MGEFRRLGGKQRRNAQHSRCSQAVKPHAEPRDRRKHEQKSKRKLLERKQRILRLSSSAFCHPERGRTPESKDPEAANDPEYGVKLLPINETRARVLL